MMRLLTSYLRWHDEQVPPTVAKTGANHPLGVLGELHTEDVLLLLGAQPVVVELVVLVAGGVRPLGLGDVVFPVTGVEDSLVVMSPGDPTKLDLLNLLVKVLASLHIPELDGHPVTAGLGEAVGEDGSVMTPAVDPQADSPVVREGVGVQQHSRLRVESVLHVDDAETFL